MKKPTMNRRGLPVALGVASLSIPAVLTPAQALAATKTYKTTTSDRWGAVMVTITVANKKLKSVNASSTYHTPRSQQLDNFSIPTLKSEALSAKSANIHTVSGATITSKAFISSLHSDLNKAHI